MSEIKLVPYDLTEECLQRCRRLYRESFPKNERTPGIEHFARKKNVDYFAVYDGDSFVGISYNVRHRDIVYIFYLAVSPEFQGMGYGSKILSLLKDKYSGCRLILNIEEVEAGYSNYEQRLKRLKFYEQNGFRKTGLKFKEIGVTYDMLCFCPQGSEIKRKDYLDLVKDYLGGFLYYTAYKLISI